MHIHYVNFLIVLELLFIIFFKKATIIENFKKSNDIQIYKEILAFVDGKQLIYQES